MRAKLVRDKIPDIIAKSGRNPLVHVATPIELPMFLELKMQEEVREFFEADTVDGVYEELGDIYEVFAELCDFANINPYDVRNGAAYVKGEARGRFHKHYVLTDILEGDK